jgi:TPR repeat protein
LKTYMKNIVVTIVFALISAEDAIAGDSTKFANAIQKGNIPLAVIYAKPLAENGDVDAQIVAGTLLVQGDRGVEKDVKSGIHFLEMCIENPKATDAQKGGCYWNLTFPYFGGESGIPADMDLVIKYVWRAARLGHEKAIDQLTESVCKNRGSNCPNVLQQRLAQCTDPCLK